MAEEVVNTVYFVDNEARGTLSKRFGAQLLNEEQVSRAEDIRHGALNMAVMLSSNCPPSRELSLALTKLEEVSMWAIKSIARNESEPNGD